MLSAQQANDSSVQRLLNRRQLGVKFPETHAEKFCSLVLQVRIRKLGHQYEQQFRVLWRGDAVYGLQVLQIGVTQLRGMTVTARKNDKSHNNKQHNAQQGAEPQDYASGRHLFLGSDFVLRLHICPPAKTGLRLNSDSSVNDVTILSNRQMLTANGPYASLIVLGSKKANSQMCPSRSWNP